MGLTIAITGGTGSFGQKAVEKLLKLDVYDKIIVYSRDEHKQEQMAAKFHNDCRLRFFIGDVRDKDRLKLALGSAHHIIHAAALKIVPAGEYNPFEFVKTNTLGTQNVLECASIQPWTRVITLSTDKAAMPINLYGATKLAAEKLTLAYNNVHGRDGPRFSVVRYGNVAGSNGSVIPLFAKQFVGGEPFTITDLAMTRYWITLDDAADFVLNKFKSDVMKGAETFIPKMPSFKVTELCRAFTNGQPFPQKIIGVRPGEKIHETLDGLTHSCDNDTWLDWRELRRQLIDLGYKLDWPIKKIGVFTYEKGRTTSVKGKNRKGTSAAVHSRKGNRRAARGSN